MIRAMQTSKSTKLQAAACVVCIIYAARNTARSRDCSQHGSARKRGYESIRSVHDKYSIWYNTQGVGTYGVDAAYDGLLRQRVGPLNADNTTPAPAFPAHLFGPCQAILRPDPIVQSHIWVYTVYNTLVSVQGERQPVDRRSHL